MRKTLPTLTAIVKWTMAVLNHIISTSGLQLLSSSRKSLSLLLPQLLGLTLWGLSLSCCSLYSRAEQEASPEGH